MAVRAACIDGGAGPQLGAQPTPPLLWAASEGTTDTRHLGSLGSLPGDDMPAQSSFSPVTKHGGHGELLTAPGGTCSPGEHSGYGSVWD